MHKLYHDKEVADVMTYLSEWYFPGVRLLSPDVNTTQSEDNSGTEQR